MARRKVRLPHKADRVTRQARDAIGKAAFDFMVGHSLRCLGIRLPRIVRSVPTELHQPAPKTRLPDRIYALANGEYVHIELQTTRPTAQDVDRFLEYDWLTWQRDHRRIHTVVLHGGRDDRPVPDVLAAGSITYRMHNVYLNRIDGDQVIAALGAATK